MKFPFAEVNMHDIEHANWVRSQRDPELWHAAAIAVINYLGDPHGFLVWLANQPDTDRATAGYFFFAVNGSQYLRGEKEFHGEGLSSKQWLTAMEAICQRSVTGFTNDSLGLHPGVEVTRQECLDIVSRGQAANGITIPRALLDRPFPPEKKLQYFVEDGTLLDYNPNLF